MNKKSHVKVLRTDGTNRQHDGAKNLEVSSLKSQVSYTDPGRV
jgi:hypothetical protein